MVISVIPLIVPIAVVPEPPATSASRPVQRNVKPTAESQKSKSAGPRTEGEEKDPHVGQQVDTSA